MNMIENIEAIETIHQFECVIIWLCHIIVKCALATATGADVTMTLWTDAISDRLVWMCKVAFHLK